MSLEFHLKLNRIRRIIRRMKQRLTHESRVDRDLSRMLRLIRIEFQWLIRC